ncbi:MAG: efflux RND transporter periplasmic adaptor subunit [Candidatus Tectomicrobia bacterium]|nr:efflux RND transporter periplasmic adaptor subunit [Candidatus Tectomicrobia bacterium]
MRRRTATALVIALVAGAGVLAYTFFSPAPAVDSPAAAQEPPVVKPHPVQTVIARRGTLTQSISATGDILAEARVEVFPKIAGHLEELSVEEGDAVRAGQVIARIANAEFEARVAKAAAEVEALQAEWAQMQTGALPEEIAQAVDAVEHTRAELANAEGFANRARGMVERGLQPTQELDDATRRLRQARATHNSASQRLQLLRTGARSEARQALQARLRAAQAAHDLATIELQHTVIASPMDGVVSHRHVDRGAYVKTTETPVVTIQAMRTVKIEAPISERDIVAVRPGHRALIRVDAYADELFSGTVRRLAPTVDPSSRSGEVEITLANPDFRLKPGMFAKVTLLLAERENVVLVPRDALRPDGAETTVFVVRDGIAHRQPVSTGLMNDTLAEIREGLAEGDEVVLSGHNSLRDQVPVNVVQSQGQG